MEGKPASPLTSGIPGRRAGRLRPPRARASAGTRHDAPTALRSDGPEREAAARELHALLLRAARFEIGRRTAALAHVRGEDADDLALQAADDALAAVLEKLDEFRGDSRFSTWAYKFALYEAGVRVRRRAWQEHEVVLDGDWRGLADASQHDPHARAGERELIARVGELIGSALTPRQREVLVALAIDGVPIDVLAERLETTRGALYKTLHDARRKLRAELASGGYTLP